MATIKLQGNASGSGSVTLTAPNTNSTRTITLPDQDMDLGSLAGAGGVKAWVTFEMDGTASIIADGGVSSLTDQGSGNPLFTLSNAISADNGSVWAAPGRYHNGAEYPLQSGAKINSTTQWEVYCGQDNTTKVDWDLGYSGLIR